LKPFFILAACALILSGCYASTNLLLDPDAAVHPMADGVYTRDGDPDDRFQISVQADGWYLAERFNPNGTIGESDRVLVNAMDPIGGHPAFAIAVETPDGFDYATAFTDGQRVFLATPDCSDPLDRNLAVDQTGEQGDDADMTRTCKFHNRGALLAALTAFAGQADFGRPYQRH
jgi:hypothetical protein